MSAYVDPDAPAKYVAVQETLLRESLAYFAANPRVVSYIRPYTKGEFAPWIGSPWIAGRTILRVTRNPGGHPVRSVHRR
jgi:hypothetical protein